jgi:hypothetical protein
MIKSAGCLPDARDNGTRIIANATDLHRYFNCHITFSPLPGRGGAGGGASGRGGAGGGASR